ncbi:MAG TPA: translation elongation factor Ts [Gemmatimonadaceae bacterium]|nr:translation elongation factor Ts [Gemmatimonadaceae bacterium]
MTATISAKLVADLRARTGAGMMDCKKALEETGGDVDQAIDLLRKKGIAKAEKRAGRAASEGQIIAQVSPDGKTGVLIELNCETDFVARTEEFKALAESVARHVAADTKVNGLALIGAEDTYLSSPWTQGGAGTLGEVIKAASAKTGENVVLRRIARFAGNGVVGFYLHHNGKVAVLVEMSGGSGDNVASLAKSIAEHVAAGVPTVALAVDRSGVDERLVERERAIYAEQAASSGKPANIVEKMVTGRLEKYFAEVTLLGQPWVRDDSKTIKQLVAEGGAGLGVTRFVRFQMGEE